MKKLVVSLLVGLLAIGSMTCVHASDEITVMVLNQKVEFDQEPVIDNGRILVPLRAIFEALNAEVYWDDATQTITAYKSTAFKEDIVVNLQIGSNEMTVSRTDMDEDKKVVLDAPATVINGRTLVPVRAISESLECEVYWLNTSSTVVITPFDADQRVITCFNLSGELDSIVIEDYKGRVIKEVVYSITGEFEYMTRFDFNDNEREVTTYYADGTVDSRTEEYYEE